MQKWPVPTPKKIIVRMPNWLGDAVMATPVLADLKAHFKESEITVMCQSSVVPLMENNPFVDAIVSYRRPNGWIHRAHHFEIIEPLRRGKYDLGLLLTNSFSSAWLFWYGNVKNRIGYTGNFRTWLLNRAVAWPKELENQHLVVTYKHILEPLGIPISKTPTQLYVSEQELSEAKELLLRYDIDVEKDVVIGVNPAAAFGLAKCWLPERFSEVTRRLIQDPKVKVIYFGDQNSAPLVDSICREMPESVLDLAGKTTLRELMALVKCCNVFLTNDSGPMHIAAALGTPVVALFGSTSDVKTGPLGKSVVVIHKHVECSPCYKRTCPIDFRCMKQIEVDEVYKEVFRLIEDI
ncbi:MAG: lipopolysaccharide heptosyltransferase II [Waddliaceae bacterium]